MDLTSAPTLVDVSAYGLLDWPEVRTHPEWTCVSCGLDYGTSYNEGVGVWPELLRHLYATCLRVASISSASIRDVWAAAAPSVKAVSVCDWLPESSAIDVWLYILESGVICKGRRDMCPGMRRHL